MGLKGKNPHNALVIDTFSQIEHARGMLQSLIPKKITKLLNFSTLELTEEHLVDEKLRELETDLLYRIDTKTGTESYVYILLEHQSTSDDLMMFRLLKYIVRIWDHWQRSRENVKKLPPIVPVVLSHAEYGWTAPTKLIDIVDGPEDLIKALLPFIPNFSPVIEDLTKRSDDELMAMKLSALARLSMLLLKHIRDGDLMERLPKWIETIEAILEGSGMDALTRALVYIVECGQGVTIEGLKFIDEAIQTPEGSVTMNLAEKLREEGRKEAWKGVGKKAGRLSNARP